jgi:Predicted restriction endonuclease
MHVDHQLVSRLDSAHLQRLAWFEERQGKVSFYPTPLDGGLLVVSRPKGIYKPKDLQCAVSVRINVDSRYPDGEVITRPDGSWFFAYHQENPDPSRRDDEYTNLGLMACIRDRVPVGILREREETASGRTQYDVLGLAYPVLWKEGYFYLDSSPLSGTGRDIVMDVLTATAEGDQSEEESHQPPPKDDYDARLRLLRQIVARRGQAGFRRALLKAYGGRCAVTGFNVSEVLEAAHLRPYRGPESNTPTNGLLLRGDVHTLLDLRLLAIDPTSRTVTVSEGLATTDYADLAGRRISEPNKPAWRPHEKALKGLWKEFRAAEDARSH